MLIRLRSLASHLDTLAPGATANRSHDCVAPPYSSYRSCSSAVPSLFDTGGFRPLLDPLELLERRYGNTSTVFCTQYAMKDWHPRVGGGVHADAIMDRIIHNTIWIETGSYNMREHAAINGA